MDAARAPAWPAVGGVVAAPCGVLPPEVLGSVDAGVALKKMTTENLGNLRLPWRQSSDAPLAPPALLVAEAALPTTAVWLLIDEARLTRCTPVINRILIRSSGS